jgi:LmbE family N-acetylglucosaminyl deacetylase
VAITERDLGTTCVVSPHFDDAVLSCTELMTRADRSTVITVFSSGPKRAGQISGWDRVCGFSAGDDVMAVRAAEDAAALASLEATPTSLGFSQYRAAVPYWARFVIARGIRVVRAYRSGVGLPQRVGEALIERVHAIQATTCAVPLGVSHADHKLTTLACLQVARQLPGVRWLIYEDMPYSIQSPSARAAAFRKLNSAGFVVEPISFDDDPNTARKRAALAYYGTQLRGLGESADLALATPERYYLLKDATHHP